MKNIRKFLAVLMTLALCLTLFGGAFAEEADVYKRQVARISTRSASSARKTASVYSTTTIGMSTS